MLREESLARFRTYVKLPTTADADLLAKPLREGFREKRIEVTTVSDRKRDLGRAMENMQTLPVSHPIRLFITGSSTRAAQARLGLRRVAGLHVRGAEGQERFDGLGVLIHQLPEQQDRALGFTG